MFTAHSHSLLYIYILVSSSSNDIIPTIIMINNNNNNNNNTTEKIDKLYNNQMSTSTKLTHTHSQTNNFKHDTNDLHHIYTKKVTPITTPLKSNRIHEIVQSWYANYITDILVDQALLFELVTAANFMDIKSLLDLTCLAVSILIKGKTPEEIRCIFNIGNEHLHRTNM